MPMRKLGGILIAVTAIIGYITPSPANAEWSVEYLGSKRGVQGCALSDAEREARKLCRGRASNQGLKSLDSRVTGYSVSNKTPAFGARSCLASFRYRCKYSSQAASTRADDLIREVPGPSNNRPPVAASNSLPSGFDCRNTFVGLTNTNVCNQEDMAAIPEMPAQGIGLTSATQSIRTLVPLNVRSRPSTQSQRVGQLAVGSCSQVSACSRGSDGHMWCQLQNGSWVAKTANYQGRTIVTFRNGC